MSKTKQKSTAAKSVAIFFIVFIILELLVLFGLSRVFKNKDVTPSVMGYSMYIMSSDKMQSDDAKISIPKGALVVASEGSPSKEGINKAVIAENIPGVGTSVFWMEELAPKEDGTDGVVYTLSQTKNPSKKYYVNSENIVGVTNTYYMTAGKVIGFLTTTVGVAICVIIPLFLWVLIEMIIAIKNHACADDDEEEDTDDDEEVELDDFLFGGENEKSLQEKHKAKASKKHDQVESSVDDEEQITPDLDLDLDFGDDIGKSKEVLAAEEIEIAEESFAPAVEDVQDVPDEDLEKKKAYYEKASRLLDSIDADETEIAETVEDLPAVEEVVETKVDIKQPEVNEKLNKSATTSLEDLMKLMEEEQKKLRDQFDK